MLRISAWRALFFSDMHACFLAIFYLLLVDETKALSYDFILKILALVTSLGLYIVYMFLVNDYFDMPTDKIAGKIRQIHYMPRVQVIGLIILIFMLGQIVTILLIGQTLYTLIYLISYFLATLYSAPPLRFKTRGILGTFWDALIEKSIPALLIFSFFQRFSLDTLFLLVLFFVWEVELITLHQYLDYEGDLKAQIKTYVVEIGLKKTLRILNYLQLLVALLILVFFGIFLVQVPYSIIFFISVGVGYLYVHKVKRSNLVTQRSTKLAPTRHYKEDQVTHFYYSFLNVCLEGLFPLFTGLMLTIRYFPCILLLLLSIASQYYFIRLHYLPLLQGTLSLIGRIH